MRRILEAPLTVKSRLLALLLSSVYQWFLIQVFEIVFDISMPMAAICVVLGQLTIMVCLGLLSMKFAESGDSKRIRLSTILLLFVPIGIYLGTVRLVVRELPPNQDLQTFEWILIAGMGVSLAIVNTIILLWYAEALVWLWKVVARFWRNRSGDGAAGQLRRKSMVFEALPMRRGHFVYESGHHGDLWLELELLFRWPERVRPLALELADRLSMLKIDAVCGPLVEGAYVALMVAEELQVQFCYTERVEHPERDGLFPVEYRLPKVLAERLRGKRVAIANDVINAGSAVQGTIESLEACEAKLVAIACLGTLGDAAAELAAKHQVPLYSLTAIESKLWTPEECPLCRQGVALSK